MERVRAANYAEGGGPRDVLSDFAAFAVFARGGADLRLEFSGTCACACACVWGGRGTPPCGGRRAGVRGACAAGGATPPSLVDWMLDLTRTNMEALYEGAWGWSDAVKRKELTDEARCRGYMQHACVG